MEFWASAQEATARRNHPSKSEKPAEQAAAPLDVLAAHERHIASVTGVPSPMADPRWN